MSPVPLSSVPTVRSTNSITEVPIRLEEFDGAKKLHHLLEYSFVYATQSEKSSQDTIVLYTRLVPMIQTEDPPAKVSSILLSYNEVKEKEHPVTVEYYAKDLKRLVNFTVKVPLTIEELKQELRTSLKSGMKYTYESDLIAVSVVNESEGVGS